MAVLIIGSSRQQQEFEALFEGRADSVLMEAYPQVLPSETRVVFDCSSDPDFEVISSWVGEDGPVVFSNTVEFSVAEIQRFAGVRSGHWFGFNAWPGCINRSGLEVSVFAREDEANLEACLNELGLSWFLVDDRVGLVTPRVISMIINEAYYTVMEGTASREDIDQAMKLGTNYPYGPFEWAEMIGKENVYNLLDALYQDTHEERYKISPLLKKEVLRA